MGALVVRRKTPGEFAQSTIELLQTFADQAVVAIENVRLFDSVQTRTRELAESRGPTRHSGSSCPDTKARVAGQVTAGIAHDIKNPLNFVDHFSGVSTELVDELHDTLKVLPLDDTRAPRSTN